MNKTDFSLEAIKRNFKALFADKKQFVFECVRLGLLFFFFIWLWLPYFTFRETITSTVAHFNVGDHAGFFGFVCTLLIIVWFLGLIFIHPLSLLTSYKKYNMFIVLGLGAIELLYWFITLIVYWVNLSDVNDLNMPTASLPLSIGFWFILLHIILVALLAFFPKPFKALTDKIVVAAMKPKAAKPEPSVVPAEETKPEPKVEEPKPAEEPKPEPVEEVKAEPVEEAKPEPSAEPKPEDKPAPKKTTKPKPKPTEEPKAE